MPQTDADRRAKTKWRLNNPEKQRASIARCIAAKPEKYKAKAAEWAANNPEKRRAYGRAHDAKLHRKKARGDAKARQQRYRQNNLEKVRKGRRDYQTRRRSDPVQRAIDALRRRLRTTCHGVSRGALTGLGYTASDLRAHLEAGFKPGMTWENYGKWHIDHIAPVSSFNLPMQMLECFALSNLQPLWASDNLRKGSRGAMGNP